MNRFAILLGMLALGACNPDPPGLGTIPTNPNPPQVPDPINPIQTDRIVQIAQPEVDILFIIDDSCSMSEEQLALAQNFPQFMNYFLGSGLDYHMGVTTTDMEAGNESGLLRRAAGLNFIDEDTPNPSSVFGTMIQAGTGGSATETGRQAAYSLLELRRDAPRNAGFYREDASLHMIFVSDEQDQSASPPRSEFINWMHNLKWSPDMVAAHAITGLPGQSCGAIIEPGTEYVFYAQQTNGIAFSLCTQNWAPLLEELGLQTSGLKREYFLSKIPVTSPWGLEVKVIVDIQGQSVTRRFSTCFAGEEIEDPECEVTYNPGRNSIVFLEYVPEPFSQVIATYNIREIFEE